MWHYVAIRCVGCGVRRSENLFVCLSAKHVQRTEGEISRETGSGRGKVGSREDIGSIDKERRREAVDNGEREIAIQGKDGQQKEAVREDSQRLVGIPSGFYRSFAPKTHRR